MLEKHLCDIVCSMVKCVVNIMIMLGGNFYTLQLQNSFHVLQTEWHAVQGAEIDNLELNCFQSTDRQNTETMGQFKLFN